MTNRIKFDGGPLDGTELVCASSDVWRVAFQSDGQTWRYEQVSVCGDREGVTCGLALVHPCDVAAFDEALRKDGER